MITPELVLAFALRHPVVMDELGDALRSDLVVANPFHRRIVQFAEEFLTQRRKLPGAGDYEVWLLSLEEGMARDGAKDALGRLQSISTEGYDPAFFSSQVITDLQKAAAQNAKARLNAMPSVDPAAIAMLAEQVAQIRGSGIRGLARLSDIDIWAQPVSAGELVSTGFPTLDSFIGGWGKELWLAFADSKAGKTILLQNFSSNLAVRGKVVLHVTLELGLRPQIHRYYRQLAEFNRSEFNTETDRLKTRLKQWFRLAAGSVYLLEFPAYSLDVDELRRTIERVGRAVGKPVDVLVLDYIDLMVPTKKNTRGSDYGDQGRLTHEVRSLCPAFDLTVLTVSQAVRRPEKAGRLTMKDIGDSYGKIRGVDGILSLVQTPEEEEAFQGRLGILNTRDSGGRGQEIALYINKDLSLIQELDTPNTIQLMRRLGQIPGGSTAAVRVPPPGSGRPGIRPSALGVRA